ncbi:MAG: cysteine--tRNA ligase [Planctomycetota bacterium]|nr:cysteine--tRNA ligase [Planctomycetota bacterium]
MPLHLFNSLARKVEPFEPHDPRRVTVYACGPTVYSHVHIGNWSLSIVSDFVVRWLRESGYPVVYAQNITDVEDKIIRDAQAAGMDRATFTRGWTDKYLAGMDTLGCTPQVNHFPRATDYVHGMVAMIQTLLDKGHAYLADDGSIYFRIASFPTYGELANLDRNTLQAGASGRVQADEYDKESVGDFALWKGYVETDGDVFWKPTFTVGGAARVVKGRPGWHIECSAMSSALLGPSIDIHLGGEDLLFPHHQNEIAQSEAALGQRPFVRYWMHHKHLLVNGAKMSKSKGNFFTLQDLFERYGSKIAPAFRLLILSGHYRKSLDFTFAGLEAAAKTLLNLREARERFARTAAGAAPSAFADAALATFVAALDEDLNGAEALAALHGLVGEANRHARDERLAAADAAAVVTLIDKADRVFGLRLASGARELSADQQALVDARAAARLARDWAEADRLRDVLAEVGILVKDGKDGQEITFV